MSLPEYLAPMTPVIRALEAEGVPCYIGGSVVSSILDVPRTTLDVDLVAPLKGHPVLLHDHPVRCGRPLPPWPSCMDDESGSGFTILHSFGSGTNTQQPYRSLALLNGWLYGNTLFFRLDAARRGFPPSKRLFPSQEARCAAAVEGG